MSIERYSTDGPGSVARPRKSVSAELFAEEEGELPLGALPTVGAVNDVRGDDETEIAAYRPRWRLQRQRSGRETDSFGNGRHQRERRKPWKPRDFIAGVVAEARGRYNVRIYRSNFPFDYRGSYAQEENI